MSISIQSIARDLGLSKATVSNILAGRGEEKGFSASTIETVQNYASSVGYVPNLLARSLSTGKSKTVGLIIPAIGDTFYSQMIQAIEKPLSEAGYSLLVASSEGDSQKETKIIQLMRSKKVDGLIIAPSKIASPDIGDMLRTRFPFVLIDRYYPDLDTNYVIVDNENSSCSLVQCLMKQGARKIAILTTDTHLFVMKRRMSGYLRALTEAGIDIDESLCLSINRSDYQSDTPRKLKALLKTHPDVDGFFLATHYLALESVRFFISRGIDYNNRFQMGCFHTTNALDVLAPKMLFSIMPIGDMGAIAVSVLLGNINAKEPFKTTHLILRNTLI